LFFQKPRQLARALLDTHRCGDFSVSAKSAPPDSLATA
jgi:hypothetical protein